MPAEGLGASEGPTRAKRQVGTSEVTRPIPWKGACQSEAIDSRPFQCSKHTDRRYTQIQLKSQNEASEGEEYIVFVTGAVAEMAERIEGIGA